MTFFKMNVPKIIFFVSTKKDYLCKVCLFLDYFRNKLIINKLNNYKLYEIYNCM